MVEEAELDRDPIRFEWSGTIEEAILEWSRIRQQAIPQIRQMAEQIDASSRVRSVSSVAGSSIGLAGGGAVVAGALIAPPVAVAGVILSFVGAGATIGGEVYLWRTSKKRLEDLQQLLYDDTFAYARIRSLMEEEEKARIPLSYETAERHEEDREKKSHLGRRGAARTGINLTKAAGVAGTSISINLLPKLLTHGAAAFGAIFDLYVLLQSGRDLLSDEKSALAQQLQLLADELEVEREHVLESALR